MIQLLTGWPARPGQRVPRPGLGDYDKKIAVARQHKDAALDAGHFDHAAWCGLKPGAGQAGMR